MNQSKAPAQLLEIEQSVFVFVEHLEQDVKFVGFFVVGEVLESAEQFLEINAFFVFSAEILGDNLVQLLAVRSFLLENLLQVLWRDKALSFGVEFGEVLVDFAELGDAQVLGLRELLESLRGESVGDISHF